MFNRDIWILLAATFLYISSPNLINPVIAGYAGTLGASAAIEGIVGGVMYIGSLCFRPFAGNWADRISKYKLTMIGLIIMLIACAGYYVSVNPMMLIIARIINGIGYCICSISITTWISDLFPANKTGSGMGFYGMVTALGMAIGPSVSVYLNSRIDMRMIFAIAAGCLVLCMVLIQFINNRGKVPAKAKEKERKDRKMEVVLPSAIPLAVIISLFIIPFFASESLLVNYVQEMNLPIHAALFFPVYSVVLIVLRLILKDWFDRLPFKVFLYSSAISSLVSLICMTFMRSDWVMFIGAAAMAGGYGIMSSECQSTAILIAGPEKKGLANSTYYIGIDLGLILGPIIGGQILQSFPVPDFYPFLMITVPLILLVYFLNRKELANVH